MVQILLATYNGEKYLREQLDSVFNQTYKDFEILVRDDGSTDSTLSILNEYKERYPDKIKITQNSSPTGNAKDNFFLLIDDADADFVCFCDQDDVWLPEKLEITLEKIKTFPKDQPSLVHTDLYVADEHLNIIYKSFFKMQHFNRKFRYSLGMAVAQNTVTGCTTMINRALLNLVKNTNCDGIIMHDWWLAIIASTFGNVGVVKTPTILYRQHQGNSVGAKTMLQRIRSRKNVQKQLDVSFMQAIAFAKKFKNMLTEKQYNSIIEYGEFTYNANFKSAINIIKNKFLKQSPISVIAQIAGLFLLVNKRR